MTIPEQVVGLLQKNKGKRFCKTCIAHAIRTTSEPMVSTIMSTLALCDGYSAELDNCPSCRTSTIRSVIKAC
jgi:hypothetical protein